ncbi:hypothetical protein [Pseudomonas fulva]|uniref:hypothetical protein n=1 Tax=Pseudomonas fulva TaxID=47880 RepID=UPI00384AFC14
MSYCRFSSDDYQCDVYVYEGANGYVVSVAGNRLIFTEDLPEKIPFSTERLEEFFQRMKLVDRLVDKATRVPLGLQFDGQDFIEQTASACADRLVLIQAAGYRVPQCVINALREEAEPCA